MHVFIDTNIILNFFHFTKDELDSLQNVFASHEHGSAEVHLTRQVCDEFKRNRENKINDALKRFKDNKFTIQLPSFMKAYEEYGEIKKLSSEIQKKQTDILSKVAPDIAKESLSADNLVKEIFDKSKIIETEDVEGVFNQAYIRATIGNPPGKPGSIGDAINWVTLLQTVPYGEDIHIISEDGDFYSFIDEKSPNPFLVEEWKEKKKSEMFVYRTLSEFIKEHFDGVAFSFDKNKEALIENLKYSGSFSATHFIIAKLEEYSYFSLKEVCRILDAVSENDQVRSIITDHDISDFLNRVVMPHSSNISDKTHRQIIQEIRVE